MSIAFGNETYDRANRWLFGATFFLSPLIAAIVPRSSPAILLLVAGTLVLAARRRGLGWQQLLKTSHPLWGFLAFSLYAFINASWAVDAHAGYSKACLLLGVIVTAFAAANAANALTNDQVRRATLWFAAGAFLGAVYLLIEVTTDGGMTRAAMNLFSSIQPHDTKRVTIVNGHVTGINPSKFNLNATVVMMSAWPALFVLMVSKFRHRRVLVAIFSIVAFSAVLLSNQASSQIALLLSTTILMLAWRAPVFALRVTAAFWCLGFALALPIGLFASNAGPQLLEALPSSYKSRIMIWGYTSEQALGRPWLGAGVASTRSQNNDDTRSFSEKSRLANRFEGTTGHHGHSIFVQTWYELGAIGALLAAVAGALLALAATTLHRRAMQLSAATFSAFAAIAAFAWGTWQTWWMCTAASTAIYVWLVNEVDVKTARRSS